MTGAIINQKRAMPARIYILVYLCLLSLLSGRMVHAQTYSFARLTGSPLMDTRGWNLTGDARIGDTNGDSDAFSNEMVLCSPTNFNNGACFYTQPVNISECQKWVAEFDYRIFDGTGADGIAFCFLANPPTGFLRGGNLGIPSRPKGLMVILDTWLNCPGTTPVPKLEIRYADGNTSYGNGTESALECPQNQQPTTGPIGALRQDAYNRMKITYNFGRIDVFINNTPVLNGNYKIDFPGYFGFTASTGGSTDRHSVRDFVLYTFKPIVSPPNAGLDRTVCSGNVTQLGVAAGPNDPYRYFWSPATGLSNPNISNPTLTLTNDTYTPVTYTYFITKDSLVDDTLCAYSDAVNITVLGKFANAGPDQQICSGASRQIGNAEVSGYSYSWSPASGLSNPQAARPFVQLNNTTSGLLTYQYILTATFNATGCTDKDTVSITVFPKQAAAGPDVQFCSGGNSQIGAPPAQGFTYRWSPKTGLDDTTKANPVITLTNTTGLPQMYQYIVTATTAGSSCGNVDTDTVNVRVFPQVNKPQLAGVKSICPNATEILYKIANPQPDVTYTWSVSGGSIQTGQGTSQILVNWQDSNATADVAVTASSNFGCGASSSRMPVKINIQLETEIPFSPLHADTLCLPVASNIKYEVNKANGSVYTWGVSENGTIVSGNGTHSIVVNWTQAGRGKIWINEQNTTSTDVCLGSSDTLQVIIAPLPEATQITGITQVCAFTNNVTYRLNGAVNSVYQWQVAGGNIVATTANEVTINWHDAGTGTLTAREITQFGCESELIRQDVVILPLPNPRIISTDLAICPQRFTGLTYQVAGSAGSSFSWQLTHGQITSSNADSTLITVNWDETHLNAVELIMTEISEKGCTRPLTFPLLFDASQVVIKSVSVHPTEQKNIELRFQIMNAPALPNQFSVSRRTILPEYSEWSLAGSVSQLDTIFVDQNLQTESHSYEYKIEGKNRCDIPLESIYHHSILLKGTGDEEKETIQLEWNSYSGWTSGVKTYEIWRRMDEETEFSLYAAADKNQVSYLSRNAKDGFRQCFRLRSLEEGGGSAYSWSNEVCLEFIHALFIPNVITPNNDGYNDYWTIENLHLYPSHEILIYNRFGKEIYRSRNYEQNWDGNGLSNGVYYYQVHTARNNQSLRGWIHVLR